MQIFRALATGLVFVVPAVSAPAWAQAVTVPAGRTQAFDTATVYAGQGVGHNLQQLPGAILTADVDRDRSYFTALGFGRDLGPLGDGLVLLRDTPLASLRYGYEAVLVKHRGLQDNVEAGATARLSTSPLFVGPVGVAAAVGAGLSHAFGRPSYEDGPLNDPQRRYRTQLLFTFDLEWMARGVDNLSLVTRVHHRSGAYGLVAPRHVGSNFLAVGLRYRF